LLVGTRAARHLQQRYRGAATASPTAGAKEGQNMIDPALILEEFTDNLVGNIVTAILVGLLILGVAVVIPPHWKWWQSFPVAVVVGVCLTIAFIILGMRIIYKLGPQFEVHFGPIHLAIAIVLSGIGFAIVRIRRGPIVRSNVPKPDSWYER
jgi:hypothetical protein